VKRKIILKLFFVLFVILTGIAILLLMTVPGVLNGIVMKWPKGSIFGLEDQYHKQLAVIAGMAAFIMGVAISVLSEWLRPDTNQKRGQLK
jgi:hypothetical protein